VIARMSDAMRGTTNTSFRVSRRKRYVGRLGESSREWHDPAIDAVAQCADQPSMLLSWTLIGCEKAAEFIGCALTHRLKKGTVRPSAQSQSLLIEPACLSRALIGFQTAAEFNLKRVRSRDGLIVSTMVRQGAPYGAGVDKNASMSSRVNGGKR
jgi:hypothetical protein